MCLEGWSGSHAAHRLHTVRCLGARQPLQHALPSAVHAPFLCEVISGRGLSLGPCGSAYSWLQSRPPDLCREPPPRASPKWHVYTQAHSYDLWGNPR
jgi:hypothetical protein